MRYIYSTAEIHASSAGKARIPSLRYDSALTALSGSARYVCEYNKVSDRRGYTIGLRQGRIMSTRVLISLMSIFPPSRYTEFLHKLFKTPDVNMVVVDDF